MKKIINLFIPCILIALSSYSSNILSFNYINYAYFIPKYLFIIIYFGLIIYISINRYIIYTCLDNIYYFKLHILLNIFWLFLFFYYKLFYISLICLLFNLIIIIILLNKFIKKKFNLIYILYLLWYLYLVLINILILR